MHRRAFFGAFAGLLTACGLKTAPPQQGIVPVRYIRTVEFLSLGIVTPAEWRAGDWHRWALSDKP